MSKITLDNLSKKLKEYIDSTGMTEDQVINIVKNNLSGDLSGLNTNNKSSLVDAINELFQSANNGKELIASAIGEPLDSNDTFSAMSNDINGLLATFKTNMMKNGITVESSDKFKSLIDKIATMVEEGSGKGIQYAEGTFTLPIETGFVYDDRDNIYTCNWSCDFVPTILFVKLPTVCCYDDGKAPIDIVTNPVISNVYTFKALVDWRLSSQPTWEGKIENITTTTFDINVTKWSDRAGFEYNEGTWYAIGVGEEDTTLRDSLASILQEEGVVIAPEDDMASLITKTDEEFTNKNSQAENTRSTLANLMKDGGYDITGEEDLNSLLALLTISGIRISDIKQIACGSNHTLILKTDGSVWSCGDNGYGQLGLGDTNAHSTFTQVTTNINNDVKQIACGSNHTLILKTDGSVWSCGYNNYGQLGLGLGNIESRNIFTQVTTNINNDVKQIACGSNHVFILKNDGSVWSCGLNYYGGLGLAYTTNSNTFTQVIININNDVKQVVCGIDHTFILKTDGSIWSCGYNNYGQLGLGTSDTNAHSTFTQVTTNINNDVKQIACGRNHIIILKNDGSIWSCGYNGNGQLGLGDTTNRNTFTQVTTNINNDVKQVVCGENFTSILKNDGSIWSCGNNAYGQLGLGNTDTNAYSTFTQVTTNINKIACGGYHTIIIKIDGGVWSCGNNAYGQLGLGDTTNRNTFTQIPRGIY